MIGPGKYDDACTIVREMTGADCVLVAVIGGSRADHRAIPRNDR